MRLKNSIFLWGIPAAVIPLAALGLIATTWSERVFLQEADREIAANLDNVVTAVRRRLRIERDIADGISRTNEVHQFLPVLESLKHGRIHKQSVARFERVNRFFETFQSVRTSLDTVRILDHQGNALVKVRGGSRLPPLFDGFGEVPYVEDGQGGDGLSPMLSDLRGDGVSSLLLTGSWVAQGLDGVMPVYNTVVPLTRGQSTVGYLTINPPLLALNRTLQLVPRVHSSSLLVAELDSERPSRDGLVLFDSTRDIDLVSIRSDQMPLQQSYPWIYAAGFSRGQGVIEATDGGARTYYQEFLPYPDRLVTWMVALQVRPELLSAPFRDIRRSIVASILVALLLGLILARVSARRIADPALNLAQGMTAFTAGERGHRVIPGGPDELQLAGRAFNDMANALEATEAQRDRALAAEYRSQRLASLGQMAAGIAHEINNPINTILSLTTLIDRDLPSNAEVVRADVRSIREETERAAGTIRAILNFSHEIEGDYETFDAQDWVRESVDLAAAERRAGDHGIDLVVEGTAQMAGDRNLLQRVLINLLENAAHVSPRGESIVVRLAIADETVQVEVLDRGEGLSDEQIDRAFDPFYSTKPQGVGSGLGLSISLGVVQYHGGSLALSNRPDGGAVATIRLPSEGSEAGTNP